MRRRRSSSHQLQPVEFGDTERWGITGIVHLVDSSCTLELISLRKYIVRQNSFFMVRYPSLDVAYLSFDDDDDCEINGDLDKLDERLLPGTASHLEGKGQEPRKDYVRVGKDRWFPRSKATSDNYLPQRHSVLINSSATFKTTLPDLISEYDPPNVCQRLHHKRKEKRRI
ncbi:hypothetical protein ALC57_08395 [Trachymyrmex cornetzi]|uniref:Uncharacterized protein n=1 Tax=Trachymyrmex cornetzi TaxID=471704 RepID=A0A195E251_9HYME|nr:hypothetical protein ALC57_08395 [Trachymyrmex cornetzi]